MDMVDDDFFYQEPDEYEVAFFDTEQLNIEP